MKEEENDESDYNEDFEEGEDGEEDHHEQLPLPQKKDAKEYASYKSFHLIAK